MSKFSAYRLYLNSNKIISKQGRSKSKVKGSNGDTTGTSSEIKGVLKRTQTFRVNPSTSSQIPSSAMVDNQNLGLRSDGTSVLPSSLVESQLPPQSPSTDGTPTTSLPLIRNESQIPDESGSSTTATSIGGANVKRGSASITTRGKYDYNSFEEFYVKI